MDRCASACQTNSHHDTTWWRPTAKADGAKVSRSRAPGTQATEVDSVGVHAFAAENVWTRDPDVDPTKSLPEEEVETSWVSARCGELRRFVAASAVKVGPQPCLVQDEENGFRRGPRGHVGTASRMS